jgi:predicted nucleic acid-binding protein
LSLYDTRFFFEHYYSKDPSVLEKTKGKLEGSRKGYVSAITVHETYRLTLEKEGRDAAELRASLMEKDFEVIPVDAKAARVSAQLRKKYGMPMADSMIAAAAKMFGLKCITDDPHLTAAKEIRTGWL